MTRPCLVDPYVTYDPATFEVAIHHAQQARLDAVVLVGPAFEEAPDPEALTALGEEVGVALYWGREFEVDGVRMLSIETPEHIAAELDLGSGIEALLKTVEARGGKLLPVTPRQLDATSVARERRLPADPALPVVVGLVDGGTRLGRDLELEDAGECQRRVIAGTGPFSDASRVGRFATLLRADPLSRASVLAQLTSGAGIAVELTVDAPAAPTVAKKKRRRRRKRKPARAESGGETADAAKGDAPATGDDDAS